MRSAGLDDLSVAHQYKVILEVVRSSQSRSERSLQALRSAAQRAFSSALARGQCESRLAPLVINHPGRFPVTISVRGASRRRFALNRDAPPWAGRPCSDMPPWPTACRLIRRARRLRASAGDAAAAGAARLLVGRLSGSGRVTRVVAHPLQFSRRCRGGPRARRALGRSVGAGLTISAFIGISILCRIVKKNGIMLSTSALDS